jgi:Flp pilus assembly protein TadB
MGSQRRASLRRTLAGTTRERAVAAEAGRRFPHPGRADTWPLQALVIVATLCLVVFASVSWLGALLSAVVLSPAVNLAMARFASHDEPDSAHVPLSGRDVPPLRSVRKYLSMSRVSR